jgi:hypothetical protein
LVRPAPRRNVDVPAKRPPELGLAAGRHHLKLIDGVNAERNPLNAAASSFADSRRP